MVNFNPSTSVLALSCEHADVSLKLNTLPQCTLKAASVAGHLGVFFLCVCVCVCV